MTQAETVNRDSRSYRQGLVLGLTVAEVFLLLVFALLIALAALWNDEHGRRVAAEAKARQLPEISATEHNLLADFQAVRAAAGLHKIARLLADLRAGRDPQTLTPDEWTFVDAIRRQQTAMTPQAISDQWRRLTQAAQSLADTPERAALAEALQKAYPAIKDARRLIALIGQGLAAEKKGEHDWPPIINLSEAQGYFFATGKADIAPDFERHLRTVIVPQLVQFARQYGVGTIEVIGHTDEQGIAQRTSNLDAMLLATLHNTATVSSLIPADNAGLGLARAVAVTRILRQDDRLKSYTILPLSAGQLITPADRLTVGGGGADKERRRIEIRLRRSNPATYAPQATDIRPQD